MHVDEDFAELAVFVLAGVDIDLMAPDGGLLDVALAAVGQFAARAFALDHAFDDTFRRSRARSFAGRRGAAKLGAGGVERR